MIGKRLKELRKNKNLNQEELGKLINVTKVSICCYEKETRTPNLDTFEDLLKVFNVSADYLLGNDKKVVMEENEDYKIFLAKEDLELLKEIKANKELYKKLLDNPKRMIESISKKI